jgi:hypothetical protein
MKQRGKRFPRFKHHGTQNRMVTSGVCLGQLPPGEGIASRSERVFIIEALPRALSKEGGKVVGEPRGSIVARIESEKSLLQVSKSEFKKYLNTRQINTREFEFDMKQKNILFDDKKGRLTTGWKSAIHLDPTYLYWFHQQFPEDLIVTDDD